MKGLPFSILIVLGIWGCKSTGHDPLSERVERWKGTSLEAYKDAAGEPHRLLWNETKPIAMYTSTDSQINEYENNIHTFHCDVEIDLDENHMISDIRWEGQPSVCSNLIPNLNPLYPF